MQEFALSRKTRPYSLCGRTLAGSRPIPFGNQAMPALLAAAMKWEPSSRPFTAPQIRNQKHLAIDSALFVLQPNLPKT